MTYSRPSDELVYLAGYEDSAPPTTVLEVGVSGELVFLAIGTWEQSTTDAHFHVQQQIAVDAEYLIDVMKSANRNQARWHRRQERPAEEHALIQRLIQTAKEYE